MVNAVTHLSSDEWDWMAIVCITLTSLKSSCRNWILPGSLLFAHHEDEGDSSFIRRFPCHGIKIDPSYVETSGYLVAFPVMFEASIDLVQTEIKREKTRLRILCKGLIRYNRQKLWVARSHHTDIEKSTPPSDLGTVVQRMDNTIDPINYYPTDSVFFLLTLIHCVDSDLSGG